MQRPITVFLAVLLAAPQSFAAEDIRQRVEFPAEMQQHMLTNMRDHLLSLTEIQQAIATGAYDKAAEIAENRLGLSSLKAHGAAHMAQLMPAEMQAIGTAMHKAASQFAITVQETGADGNLKRAIGDLANVTHQCVACHGAYRVH